MQQNTKWRQNTKYGQDKSACKAVLFPVYLISHIFAQGNYILLILYSQEPQVNTIFLDFPLDPET